MKHQRCTLNPKPAVAVVCVGSAVEGFYFIGEKKKVEENGRWKLVRVYERNLGLSRYVIREDYFNDPSPNTISPDSFIGCALMGKSVGSLVYVCMGSTPDGQKVDFKFKITEISQGVPIVA